MMNGERGQVLLLVLAALAIGTLVITPFIGHAGSSLIGSRIYGQVITEQYSDDAGVEHAIWRLTDDGLAAQLPSLGNNITYQLSETVNGIAPSITVTKMDSSGTIYAFRGDDNKDFWRYDIATNTWTAMADAPDKVKEGSALTYDGNYIYALRGDDNKDFWRYDIATNTWTAMADAPDKVKEGSALTYDGNYIYALRGDDNKDFWRYDIQSNTWMAMADAPDKVKEGGALTNEIGANYEIVSTAGDHVIRAEVRIVDGTVSILSWEVE